MEHLKNLNDEQKRAVTEGDGAVLVVAGPGSGKTRTIISRICHQLKKGVAPERILLLTFTNKAAAEMKRRSLELAGESAGRIMAGTFHHFANVLLRRHPLAAGLNPRFTILDEDDAITLLVRVMKRSFHDVKRSSASIFMRAFSLSKLRVLPLSDIIMDDPEFFQLSKDVEGVQKIAADYENEKKSMDALDFDDLLLLAYKLLRDNPRILEHYRSQYTDILIDEFQDTDYLQAAFISLLCLPASQGRNLMVVGDDSQSIYSFRGADLRNMLEFKDCYDAKVFFLTTNYRSSDPIVKLINKCIDASSVKIDKTLTATGKGGDIPKLMEAQNPSEEAYAIASLAEQELLNGSKVGVLFRSAYIVSELELELNRRSIAYELRGGMRFAEQAHIKDMLAVLRVHENPKDKAALSRILRLLPGIGEKKAESVISDSSSMESIIQNLGKVESKNSNSSSFLREILSAEGNAAAILDKFYTSFYRKYMETTFDDAAERKLDIDALIGAAAKAPDVSSFLDSFVLSPDDVRRSEKKTDLILSTIHQAKGLEWDTVFVMGLAEGMLPHTRSSDVEEERRLFYVAVSRAKAKLYLSYSMASGRFYSTDVLQLSRFVTELPENSYGTISGI